MEREESEVGVGVTGRQGARRQRNVQEVLPRPEASVGNEWYTVLDVAA